MFTFRLFGDSYRVIRSAATPGASNEDLVGEGFVFEGEGLTGKLLEEVAVGSPGLGSPNTIDRFGLVRVGRCHDQKGISSSSSQV